MQSLSESLHHQTLWLELWFSNPWILSAVSQSMALWRTKRIGFVRRDMMSMHDEFPRDQHLS